MGDYPKIRLFVEAQFHEAAIVPLSEGQSHYLQNVMRVKAGEAVALFNGQDGEWEAALQPISKKQAQAHLLRRLKPFAPVPDVTLYFAPVKQGRVEYIVEKATELGVRAIQPVITRRSVVTRVNVEKLGAQAIEAAEQSERLDVPPVAEAMKLDAVLRHWNPQDILIYGDEMGQGQEPCDLLKEEWCGRRIGVLIGPEGGFSPEEMDALRVAPFAHALTLGPRILRADTAAFAALTLVQAYLGDWQEKPRFKG